MARNMHVISIGFSFGIFAALFLGCFNSPNNLPGKCEDDGNPCTIDSCESGGTLHVFAPDGSVCTLGENAGTCTMGVCVLGCEATSTCKCASDPDCPADEPCAEWACSAGKCTRTASNEGMVLETQNCVADTCVGGMVMAQDAAVGTVCDTGACNATGQCVDCLSADDWTGCGGAACPVKMCNGETASDSVNCKSGFAADGVCCDTTCTEVCKGCNVMGSVGSCTNIPYYQPDPSYVPEGGGPSASCDLAIGGALCSGNGECLKVAGKQCQIGTQCMSGACSSLFKCLGATGEFCTAGVDCISGACMVGQCQ